MGLASQHGVQPVLRSYIHISFTATFQVLIHPSLDYALFADLPDTYYYNMLLAVVDVKNILYTPLHLHSFTFYLQQNQGKLALHEHG